MSQYAFLMTMHHVVHWAIADKSPHVPVRFLFLMWLFNRSHVCLSESRIYPYWSYILRFCLFKRSYTIRVCPSRSYTFTVLPLLVLYSQVLPFLHLLPL